MRRRAGGVSPSTLPEGDLATADGRLPGTVTDGAAERALGLYLHVPFCAVRCGYCDFNTYTPGELAGSPGSSTAAYLTAAATEVDLAAAVLADAGLPPRAVSTVFVGGGTPTLLPAGDLVRLLGRIGDRLGLATGAEVTTEANPDSVTARSLRELADGGFTRVSFGMQSAVPHVLRVLDRTHDPARLPQVVGWARDAGLQVSLDLIYGTATETVDDWRASVETAVTCAPDHVSAYALVVEDGTRLAGQVRRGRVAAPDPDDQATKYELADDLLTAAGYGWYEVSNWARSPAGRCRHNVGYWRGDDWWGIGPGAHSHVGGVRWWNVKHPGRYAAALADGRSPAAGREVLDAAARDTERIMLGVRLVDGVEVATLPAGGAAAVPDLVGQGLLVDAAHRDGTTSTGGVQERVVLTRRGRLLGDAVVRTLLGW